MTSSLFELNCAVLKEEEVVTLSMLETNHSYRAVALYINHRENDLWTDYKPGRIASYSLQQNTKHADQHDLTSLSPAISYVLQWRTERPRDPSLTLFYVLLTGEQVTFFSNKIYILRQYVLFANLLLFK